MNFSRMPLWVKLWGSFGKRLLDVIVHGVDNAQIYEGFKFGETFDSAYDSTIPSKDDNFIKKKLKSDALRCYLRWGFTPRDYFLFGFHDKNTTTALRKTFVSDELKDRMLIKKEGWNNYLELSDKYAFYKKAKAFYGRKLFAFDEKTDKESFSQFVVSVKDLFIKPNGGSYGQGAFVTLCNNNDEANSLFMMLKDKGGRWILEERIIQDEGMARWNESSVNTIRFTSILTSKGYHTLTPVLRTGRKGSIVDNGGSGGILANIELSTGRIYTDGIDENGQIYPLHPDSGITFKGTIIPHWNQLLDTVKAAHTTVASNHKYIGWDLALSCDKWIIIEGNWGQFLNQYVDKVGRKDEFLKQMN